PPAAPAPPAARLAHARQQVLARTAALAVRARPHVVARLGGDDQLVAVGPEVLGEDRAEVALRAAVGRPVVVRQVEVGHAAVEGPAQDRALRLERAAVAEVVPQAQRDGRQVKAGASGAAEGRPLVTVRCGEIAHALVLLVLGCARQALLLPWLTAI